MIRATCADEGVRGFRIAGMAGSRQELDTLVRAVAIAGYNSVIRRLVRRHFESCEVCRLPVARQDGSRSPHLHENCRRQYRREAVRSRARRRSFLDAGRRRLRLPH